MRLSLPALAELRTHRTQSPHSFLRSLTFFRQSSSRNYSSSHSWYSVPSSLNLRQSSYSGCQGWRISSPSDSPPPPVTQPCGRCRSSGRSCGARRRPHVVPAIGEVVHLVVSLDTYIEPAQCSPLFTRTSPTQTYRPKGIASLPIWPIYLVRIVLSHLG